MKPQRLSARDYKSPRHGGPDWRRWREFGLGLALGLVAAGVVYVGDHRRGEPAGAGDPALSATREGKPARTRPAPPDPVADAAASGVGSYDFYDRLPKYEVLVPERERAARVDPAAKIDKPGTYFLQAGSYRGQPDAERVAAQLTRQDIPANVQRIAIDANVWYRVRIGPIKDLAQLNRLRRQLQAAEIESLVVRVED